MTGLVSGKAYQVYSHATDKIVGLQGLYYDEKIVIFDNGLIFAMNRNKTEKKVFMTLAEYQKLHVRNVVGFNDLFYTEPLTLSDLLIAIVDGLENYNPTEMTQIMTMLQQMYLK